MGRFALGIALIALVVSAGPTAAPEYAAPDLLFFEKQVAPDLNTHCSTCHSDPEMAQRFQLVPLDNLERPRRDIVLRNFRAAVKFIDPDNPGESTLLKKALGENGHPGGALFGSKSTRAYGRLRYFAMGATLNNRPPDAIVQKRYDCKAGEDLELDGTLSTDPEKQALHFRWRVVERPPGSVASVLGDSDGGARFKPDRAGVYRIELSVYDGSLWSLPAPLMVVASAPPPRATPMKKTPADAKATKPAQPSKPPVFVDRRLDTDRLKLVRRLYYDFKHRAPHLAEIEQWYDKTHTQMVDAFLEDEEAWDAWYEHQLYYFLLLDQFRPKEGRIATIPARLTSGKISAPRALEEIVRSQYFGARNPGNDTFVTVVLEQCLGLVVQERKNTKILELGKKMYDGYKVKLFKEKGSSQADFVRICFRQRRFFEHLLARTWKDLHGTGIDKKKLKAETDRFMADPRAFRKILREWLTAPAYTQAGGRARTKEEIPYVRGLFVDTLGRLPSYDELRNVRNAFLSLADPTPVRLVMGRVLLDSREAKLPTSVFDHERFVKEQFVRLFARPPTQRELDTFVGAMKDDPQVNPRVVLWTLISSPEYQSY